MDARRRLAAMAMFAVALGACGGGDDDSSTTGDAEPTSSTSQPAPPQTSAAVSTPAVQTTEQRPADDPTPTLEQWAGLVVETVNAQAQEWPAVFEAVLAAVDPSDDVFDTEVDLCRGEAEFLERSDAAMPEPYGSPAEDQLYADYLDARSAYRAATLELCDVAENDYGSQLYDDANQAMRPARDARAAACFPLQELFADLGVEPLLDCTGGESIGPGEAEAAGFGDVPPGPATFDEFATPFTIDHPASLLVNEGAEWIWFTRNDDTFTIEFWAVDEVGNPDDLGVWDGGSMIPAPERLGNWIDDMPIVVLDQAPIDVAGVEATRWEIQIDENEFDGEAVARLWAFDSTFPPTLEAFDGFAPPWVLWEIPHPNGELMVAAMLVEGPPEMIEWADGVVASITGLP